LRHEEAKELTTPVSIEEATMCFACGPDNPIGLQIRFSLQDGVCRGSFMPNENHVGYQNTVHGGIIFAALDDAMANVLYLQNIKAHTARCEIRYRRALAVGEEITVSGWIDSQRKRLIVLKGEARLADNTLVADCEASFMAAQS
jgi:acyl-coenzyme A thioesterase PaaI-like protein